MLRAWLKRLDVRDLRVRAQRRSASCHISQRRRALLAVELLENRITPSHLTMFSPIVPSGKEIQNATPVSATTFTVSAPATAAAGTSFNVTFTAKSASGSTVTGYDGNVTLTASDSQLVHILATHPFTNGVAMDTIALTTADTPKLTAAAGSIKGTSNGISINPAAASAFVVVVPSIAAAGTAFDVTLTAKDAYGNTATGFSGNVTFTSNDSQPVHVVGQTVFSDGAAIFAVILNTPNTVKLSAASGMVKGTSGAIAVKPLATLSSFVVSAPGTATAGTGFNVTLAAEDNYGNTVTSFSGSVTLTASDGQTVNLSASPVFSNGTALVAVTLNTADTVTLTAASGMVHGTSGSIMVHAVPVASDWFSQNMSAPGLQALARTDFTRDGSPTYSDMLGLFAESESAGVITSAELQSLQALVTPSGSTAVNMAGPVQSLTYKVVDGDPANALYQGTTLGNLQVGNPASHLQELVGLP